MMTEDTQNPTSVPSSSELDDGRAVASDYSAPALRHLGDLRKLVQGSNGSTQFDFVVGIGCTNANGQGEYSGSC